VSAVLEAQEPSARYLEAVEPALVRQFELLATAEGGVTRLRELILTLAVQGKLVPQCPGEAPASEILARARAATAEQRRERRKSASSEFEPFEPGEGSPALPLGWEWCRGADLYTVVRGVTYQKADASDSPRNDYLPILRANNIRTTVNFDDLVYVPGGLVREEQVLRPGDFVVCLASGSKNLVGKAAVFTGEQVCSFGAFCGAIRLAVPLPFFSAFLASPLYREAVADASSGIGINNLKSSTLLGLAIALPPESEQARIVARVDELMRLCDALEAKGRLEAEQHGRLLSTLLGTLTDSSTPDELAANWQRVADHFDLLLDRPEAVDALEQTVLQLAVRGLLVPQDPNDESAYDFLQRLQAARRQIGSEHKGRHEELLLPIVSGPYELPSRWLWTTIEDLADVGTGTTPSRENAAFFDGGTIPWVTSGETGQPFIRTTSQHVTEAALASTSLTVYPVGTLIVAMYGQGKTRGQVSQLCLEATTNQACAAIVLKEKSAFHQDFVKLVFEKSYDEIRELSAGGAQPNLNVGKVKASLIPVPPLAEQARIVVKVAELRRLCADLRLRLDRSNITQSSLTDALINQMLSF